MCQKPITISNNGEKITVGCGKCTSCYIKYANQWAFRFHIHANHNPIYHCVTFTYSGKHLPTVTINNRTYMTLSRQHMVTYFKKLRYLHKKRNGKNYPGISYLVAGEYGDKFKRPHYHAVIFNSNPVDITNAWTDPNGQHMGNVFFGDNNLTATIAYATKYMLKSKLWSLNRCKYERPFVNVSKGIGINLLDNQKIFPDVISFNGTKLLLPRYYTKKTGQIIDTTQFSQEMVQRTIDNYEYLKRQKITPRQYAQELENQLVDKNAHFADITEIIPENTLILPSNYEICNNKQLKEKKSQTKNKKFQKFLSGNAQFPTPLELCSHQRHGKTQDQQ